MTRMSLLLPGVREKIVHELCRAGSNRGLKPRAQTAGAQSTVFGVRCSLVSPLLLEVEHIPNRSIDQRDQCR
jgi:hypothetical protein